MRNSTHLARLLEACNISNEQFLHFVRTSKYITPRQRVRAHLMIGGAA